MRRCFGFCLFIWVFLLSFSSAESVKTYNIAECNARINLPVDWCYVDRGSDENNTYSATFNTPLQNLLDILVENSLSKEDVIGDWYGFVSGKFVSLSLRNDGSYHMLLRFGSTMDGTWEITNGMIVLKGYKTEPIFVYEGDHIFSEDLDYTMTREVPFVIAEGVEIASVDTSALLSDFQGKWKCKYGKVYNGLYDIEQKPQILGSDDIPFIEIDGNKVSITNVSPDTRSYEFEFVDGVLSYKDWFKIKKLKDGMIALEIKAVSSYDLYMDEYILYFESY